MSTFGDRLVIARKKAGYTQRSLSEALDITPTRLNYWEKNKREPNVLMIKNICRILNISPDYLIGNDTNYYTCKSEFINNYDKLNETGKEKVKTYISDLLENPKYTTPITDIKKEAERKSAAASRYDRLEIAAYGGEGNKSAKKKDREIT